MTTKVRVSIVQSHNPVIVEVLRADGSVQYSYTLRALGEVTEDYVHSNQTLRIRELTTNELHGVDSTAP